VPVFLTRRNDDSIPYADILRRLAPTLHANGAFDDEKPLRAGVTVPVGARAGFELDAIDVDGGALAVLGEQFRSRRADERIRVGGTGRSVRSPEDFHVGCRLRRPSYVGQELLRQPEPTRTIHI
jgi:hypothetical protein